jgi:hypothetical protein
MIISELKEITDNYEIINLEKRHSEILKYTNTVGGFCNGRDRVRSAYSILPPMVVNVYVAYIVYRTLRVVVIPT